MRIPPLVFPTVSLLGLVLFLTACGGSAQPKRAGEAKTSLDVTMMDYSYTPKELLVPAGKDIAVTLVNNGSVTHNFIIMKEGADVGQDFDDEDEPNVHWKIDVRPGKNAAGSFTAPSKPGEYLILCNTAGHFLAGMTGKLVVVAP